MKERANPAVVEAGEQKGNAHGLSPEIYQIMLKEQNSSRLLTIKSMIDLQNVPFYVTQQMGLFLHNSIDHIWCTSELTAGSSNRVS
jgi:hypothetical protein